ncbi:MAG: cob(I)yrinic acid a,c-diamide adenosyltransferase [Saprospiraceae bacterium]|nr:cob(I)yrinic acid a,c-diamide adenosyltransferase [Saprospiraceae bacterium]
MALKIYTKTGDAGETSLFGGTRLWKDHMRIEAYGTVDELNASIGYLSEIIQDHRGKELLQEVQNKLFNMGSMLAVDPTKPIEMPPVLEADVARLEEEIDRMEGDIPPLKQFILPSGTPQAAYAHVCRTICRRAERRVVTLARETNVDVTLVTYLNRLSDYLFELARYLNHQEGVVELKWTPDQ